MLIVLAPVAGARAADVADRAEAFFSEHCFVCHDADTKKGGLDLSCARLETERLPDIRSMGRGVRQGRQAEDAASCQETPRSRCPGESSWNRCAPSCAPPNLARQQTEGRVVLRRLNRVEYENTLHDLLAIDVPLQHYLPEDATTNGFDNVAVGLRLSMLQMEHYLEAADAAISAAMEFRQRPEGIHKRLRYHDEESVRDDVKKKEKKTFRVLPDAVVIFDDNSPTVLRQWIVPDSRTDTGFGFPARAYQAAGRPVWLKLYATDFKTQRLLAYFDMPADTPRMMEVVANLEAGQLLNLSPFDTNYDDQGRRSGFWGIGAEKYAGRGIAIEWVEVEGPLVDRWPPLECRPSLRRSSGQAGRTGPRSRVRPPGPDLHDRARTTRDSAAETCCGNSRPARSGARHVGRRRAFRQTGPRGARRRPDVRGRDGRRLPRRDHVAKVPVSRGAPRAARRLGPGGPAVLFSLEHAAGRRAAEARRQRDLAPTFDPARPGRTDAGTHPGPGCSSRTLSASGSI